MDKVIFFGIILLLILACNQKDTGNINQENPVQTLIGNIKICKNDNFNTYGIYIPLKVINYTQDTIFLGGESDIERTHRIAAFPSYFIGLLEYDTINFKTYMSSYTLLPKDSIIINLFDMYYEIQGSDSTFIAKIKDVRIKYTGQEVISNKSIKIIPEKTTNSKFIVLDNFLGVEEAFGFGNMDFE